MHRSISAALAVAGLATMTPAALAHASLETREAKLNSTYKAVLRVPHGCEGAATREVRVTLPEGFIAAKPMPKAGWQLDLVKGAYAATYDHYGTAMGEGVREIHWTGGTLADEHYDEFVFQGVFAAGETGQSFAFPVTQVCDVGEVAWTDVALPGQDPHTLRHPAPTVTLVASDAAIATTPRPHRVGDLTVEEVYARATPGGAKVAGGYLKISNHGSAPDRLVGGSATFAGRVEIHSMSMDGEVMRMRPLPEGLEINPGETVELAPGGLHVMFMNIDGALREGERRRMTLTFARAGSIEVEFPVRGLGAGAPAAGGHKHH